MHTDKETAQVLAEKQKAAYESTLNTYRAANPIISYGVSSQIGGTGIPTKAEQHSNDAEAHRRHADVSQRAANFFAAHPEFEEFLKLREEGAIYF